MDESGAWLFGDSGRPLLSKEALNQLVVGCPLSFEESVVDALAAYEVAVFLDKKGLPTSLRDQHVAGLERLFTDGNRLAHGGFLGRLLHFDLSSGLNSVELKTLPWLPETLARFEDLCLSDTAVVADLESLYWRDLVGGAEGRWVVLFDVYQMIFGWLPVAVSNNLVLSSGDSLDAEVEKFELSTLMRSTLTAIQRQRWRDLLSRRGGWGKTRETLDAIANEEDLSRERVRQVEARLKAVVLSRAYVPSRNVRRILSLDFGLKLADPGQTVQQALGINEHWTDDSIRDYIQMSASNDALNRFIEISTLDKQERKNVESINGAIRASRSDLGVIKIDAVHVKSSATPIDPSVVRAHIPLLYTEYVFSGDYALVSRGKRNYLLTSIANQLSVSSPLSLEQLLVGITRVAVQRQAQHVLPPPEVLREFINSGSEFLVDTRGNVSGLKEPISDDTVQGWIIQQLENSPGNVMSKAQVLRLAITQGQNLNSIVLYISFSSVIRSLGEGFINLVGRNYKDEDVAYAERVAAASYVNNRIVSYSVDAQTGVISVKFVFSTPFLVSGVLAVDRTLGALLGGSSRRIECCAETTTSASVRVSKGSNMAGFSSVREHMIEVHGVQEGETVRLEIDEESVHFAW